MTKIKEKLALVLSLIGAALPTGSLARTEKQEKTIETKFDAVKSFIATTDGQAARNLSNT